VITKHNDLLDIVKLTTPSALLETGKSERGNELDTKIIDYLRLLEEYRKKCSSEGNLTEAARTKLKYEEILKQATEE